MAKHILSQSNINAFGLDIPTVFLENVPIKTQVSQFVACVLNAICVANEARIVRRTNQDGLVRRDFE